MWYVIKRNACLLLHHPKKDCVIVFALNLVNFLTDKSFLSNLGIFLFLHSKKLLVSQDLTIFPWWISWNHWIKLSYATLIRVYVEISNIQSCFRKSRKYQWSRKIIVTLSCTSSYKESKDCDWSNRSICNNNAHMISPHVYNETCRRIQLNRIEFMIIYISFIGASSSPGLHSNMAKESTINLH